MDDKKRTMLLADGAIAAAGSIPYAAVIGFVFSPVVGACAWAVLFLFTAFVLLFMQGAAWLDDDDEAWLDDDDDGQNVSELKCGSLGASNKGEV